MAEGETNVHPAVEGREAGRPLTARKTHSAVCEDRIYQHRGQSKTDRESEPAQGCELQVPARAPAAEQEGAPVPR